MPLNILSVIVILPMKSIPTIGMKNSCLVLSLKLQSCEFMHLEIIHQYMSLLF